MAGGAHSHASGEAAARFYQTVQPFQTCLFRSGREALGAISEKQIKAGSRQKKLDLINTFNSAWRDLYEQL
jgi:predicted GIY-YIG superfamily endonuclease